jgi:hypothetical protein
VADDSKIQVVIELDDGSIKQGFIRMEKAAEESAGNIGGFFRRASEFAAGVLLERAFSNFFSFLKQGFTESIKAAEEQQNAINKLANSLASAGTFSQEALNSFVKLADSIQDTTTVQDDAALSLAALARNYTRTNEQAERLTRAAVDLSAQLGIDLNSAAQQIGSTFSGVVPRSLAKTVQGLKELSVDQLRAGEGVDLIAKRFKGAAENEVKTFSGALTQLKNAFDDLKEQFGNLVVRSPAVLAVFKTIKDAVVSAKNTLAGFNAGDADIFKPLTLSAINFAKTINFAVVVPITIAFNAIKIVLNDISQVILAVIGDVAGFAGRAVALVAPNSALAQGLIGLKDVAKASFDDLSLSTNSALESINNAFAGDDAINNFLNKTKENVEATSGSLNVMGENAKNSAKVAETALSSLALTANQLGNIVSTAIRNSISKSIQLVVLNIAQGKNAFEGLLKTIGGIFGDMLITIGETVLLAGLGMEAIRASVVGLTGGPAIFAGIALIAAGTLLKALSGGGAGAGGVPTTSASGGGSTTQPINEPQVVDEKAQQRVVVNIQGDVLDNRESALRIVELLNEGIVEQGAVITARA